VRVLAYYCILQLYFEDSAKVWIEPKLFCCGDLCHSSRFYIRAKNNVRIILLLFTWYPALLPASGLGNHWAASGGSLWLTATSFSLIAVGGLPLCLLYTWQQWKVLLSFIPPLTSMPLQNYAVEVRLLCCWAGLALPGATYDVCSIRTQNRCWTAKEPLLGSHLQSPSPLLSKPIINSPLRDNDIELWQLKVFFVVIELFFPLCLLLKVFNLGSKTGGLVESSTKWKPAELWSPFRPQVLLPRERALLPAQGCHLSARQIKRCVKCVLACAHICVHQPESY